MRFPTIPDPAREPLWAAIFAGDLIARCDELFGVLGGCVEAAVDHDVIELPITVPVDEEGFVVLKPASTDAQRKPAVMEVSRPAAGAGGRNPLRYSIGWGFLGEIPMVLPGMLDSHTGAPARIDALVVSLAAKGMAVAGFSGGGARVALDFDDDTACRLATALLITLGVKLSKAERGELVREAKSG